MGGIIIMASIKFKYGTEAQILALTTDSPNWVNLGFYYPSDKAYFYQVQNGVMKKIGADVSVVGVGCMINDKVIGGVKPFIAINEVLTVPEEYDYNTFPMTVDGDIILAGNINIL